MLSPPGALRSQTTADQLMMRRLGDAPTPTQHSCLVGISLLNELAETLQLSGGQVGAQPRDGLVDLSDQGGHRLRPTQTVIAGQDRVGDLVNELSREHRVLP